jgi:hypothetical protein
MSKLSKISLFIFLFLASIFSVSGQQSAVIIPEYNTGFNTVTEALDFLKNQNIDTDVNIQLMGRNYINEPSYLSTFGIQMNGYALTISGYSSTEKSRLLMDGTTPHVVDNYLSNFTLKNLVLEGANPANTNGSILRQKGNESNIRLENVDLIGGYCGIRATTKINGLHLERITTSRVPHGSFRLGNGSFAGSLKDTMLWERDSADFDMYNVVIRDILLKDDMSNETIPGSNEKYNGFLLLKKVFNLTVDGVQSESGNGGGIITVENSRNVILKNIKVAEFGYNQASSSGLYIFKCDYVEAYNNLIKTKQGDPNSHVSYYFNVVDNLSFCHNTAIASQFNDRLVFGFQLSRVNSFEGNLLKMNDYACILEFRNFDGYTATLAQDWIEVNYNAMSSSQSYLPLMNLEGIDGRDYILMYDGQANRVNQINFSDFQSNHNRELNSSVGFPEGKIEFIPNHYYQTDQSLGRNLVSKKLLDLDINGYNRTLPSDAGAYDTDNFFDINLEENEVFIKGVSVYPNPNRGIFTVELEEYPLKNIEIEIVSSIGIKAGFSSETEQSGGTTSIHVKLAKHLTPGVYFITLKANNKEGTYRFTLE